MYKKEDKGKADEQSTIILPNRKAKFEFTVQYHVSIVSISGFTMVGKEVSQFVFRMI